MGSGTLVSPGYAVEPNPKGWERSKLDDDDAALFFLYRRLAAGCGTPLQRELESGLLLVLTSLLLDLALSNLLDDERR